MGSGCSSPVSCSDSSPPEQPSAGAPSTTTPVTPQAATIATAANLCPSPPNPQQVDAADRNRVASLPPEPLPEAPEAPACNRITPTSRVTGHFCLLTSTPPRSETPSGAASQTTSSVTTAETLSSSGPSHSKACRPPSHVSESSSSSIVRSGSLTTSTALHGVPANQEVLLDDYETPLSCNVPEGMRAQYTGKAKAEECTPNNIRSPTDRSRLVASSANQRVQPGLRFSLSTGAVDSATLGFGSVAPTATAAETNADTKGTQILPPRRGSTQRRPSTTNATEEAHRLYAIPRGCTVPESEWD